MGVMEEIQPTTWLCYVQRIEKNQFQTTNLRWLMTKFHCEYTPSVTEMVIACTQLKYSVLLWNYYTSHKFIFNRLPNKYLYQLWFSSTVHLVFECVLIVGKVFYIAHDTFIMVFLTQLDRILPLSVRIAMLSNCITGMHTHTHTHTRSHARFGNGLINHSV